MGENAYDVAIIGGGFSGAMVAVHLARLAPALRVRLNDGDAGRGRGVAYGTESMRHLLNVPAGKMSALPDEPAHFCDWLRKRGEAADPAAFMPRKIYGAYVREMLEQALSASSGLEVAPSRVVDVESRPGSFRLEAENGERFTATCVVFAGGNFAPAAVPGLDENARQSPRYIHSPWAGNALSRIGEPDDVLVVGSGLTAVDVLLSLEEQGARGRIHVLSRRGLLPQQHRQHSPRPELFENTRFPQSVRGIARVIRAAVRDVEASGGDWRAVVDALRPHTQRLWRSLPIAERRRFLRHARPYWEAHRHRVAPEVFTIVERLTAAGQLTQHTARIVSIRAVDDGMIVEMRNRGAREARTLKVQFVVNCTGPQSDYRRLRDPLIANLLRRGCIVPDELAQGIRVGEEGEVIDNAGRPSSAFLTIGSPRKGELYETTAVPELRVQARDLAARIAKDFACSA